MIIDLNNSVKGQFVGVIGSFGSLIWLMFTPYNEKDQLKRLGDYCNYYCIAIMMCVGIMCSFGLFTGMTLGPALDFAIAVDPRYG